MNRYLPFMEKKSFFKYSYDISSIVRNRKNSVIHFTLQWNTVGLEPFSTFFRRKLSKCSFYKFGSTGITREKFFFIRDSRCYITSPTSWDNHFFSWCQIFFENMNMVIIVLVIFENGYGGHKSRGSCADNGYVFHRKSIWKRENSKNEKLFSFFCHRFSVYSSYICLHICSNLR